MGGCSSAWLERWPVTPEVAGSNPVSRAISTEMAAAPRLGTKRNLLWRLDSMAAVLSGICGSMVGVRVDSPSRPEEQGWHTVVEH